MTDDDNDLTAVTPRVEVGFPLAGDTVPLDHGYALYSAMSRVLGPELHGAAWLSVLPVRGLARGDGTLALQRHNTALRLRIEPARLPTVLPLAGKTLEVDGHRVLVGTSRVFALEPHPALHARMVVIKKFMEEGPFREAVARQLDARGVKATIELERRRVLRIAGDTVVGFGVTLRGLSEADSLTVQYAGVGGRQRFGCGVFTPARRET
ncbi:MAG: type I-MYXAN CRISPR-associated protein Cas6/Cmx6 [Polyangiales bacterium]